MNDEKKYKILTPFKMQVLENFPFIDADFDALTNYELLCKVVEYLNLTMEDVNVLALKVEELKHYIDNIDIEEDVSKKLDEMAEDGTLAQIINQEILNDVEGKVNKLPLKVTPNLRRLGRFLIPYGTDILSSDSAVSNCNLQGSCLTSSTTCINALINDDDTSCTLKEYNFTTGQVLREVTLTTLGHANGLCKIGDYVYVATYTGLEGQEIKKLDYTTLTVQATYEFDFQVKAIYQDEITHKVYLFNDFNVHEWELDTDNTEWLFNWNIPNYTINVDAVIQTCVVYNDMFYLLGCYNESNNGVILVINKDGSLYNTWDLKDHNNETYYGECQSIMNNGDVFYMTSVFRCGSNFYNDYQINNLFTFNPFRQIHSKDYLTIRTSATYRQIDSSVNSFLVDGTTTYPYRFYFEFCLEKKINNLDFNGTIIGDQPLMHINNENASFSVNGCNIEGITTYNSKLTLKGSNGATIDSIRHSSHAEITMEYNSKVYLKSLTIGNNTSNLNDYGVILGNGSELQYSDMTFTHTIPIQNNGGICQKTTNINNLVVDNTNRNDPQVLFIPRVDASNNVITLTIGEKAHNILTTASGKFYLQFNLRCGQNEFSQIVDNKDTLTGWSTTTRSHVITDPANSYAMYTAVYTIAYDSTNKAFVITFTNCINSSGNDAAMSHLGYVQGDMLIIC